MKSILSLIPFTLVFAASSVFGASTDCPVPIAPASASSTNAPAAAALAPKAAAPDASSTTDQILAGLFGRRSNDLVTSGRAGSKLLDLQGRFSTVSIIVRNPDGTIGHFCVDNIAAAKRLLASPSKPGPVSAAAAPLQ
jgi:hypothetical protein